MFISSLLLLSSPVIAVQNSSEQQADQTIAQLYHSLHNMPKLDMTKRIVQISEQLLGKPYVLGALGEGSLDQFDQAPLYRADAFDCETYVDTVLALALANDSDTFKQCIRQVRYRDGQVSFINRNHFTCLDWNQNNQRQYFVKDITNTFVNQMKQPVTQVATALINKPGWYQGFSVDSIRVSGISKEEQAIRLARLQSKGKKLPAELSSISYIPLSALFDSSGNANMFLFKQIPNAAIVEIVRPNWDLRKQIGTSLNISHLGFAIWDNGHLIFRQASSHEGRTVDVSLIDYLRDTLESPTIKGINVQIVVPQRPLSARCTNPDVRFLDSADKPRNVGGLSLVRNVRD